MRFACLLFSALVVTSNFAQQQPIPADNSAVLTDRYSITVVSSAFQYLQQRKGPFSSFADKAYMWPLLPLGDRVSIAVLKIYSADELVQPENAGAYHSAARTIFGLAHLKGKEISNPEIEKRIAYPPAHSTP